MICDCIVNDSRHPPTRRSCRVSTRSASHSTQPVATARKWHRNWALQQGVNQRRNRVLVHILRRRTRTGNTLRRHLVMIDGVEKQPPNHNHFNRRYAGVTRYLISLLIERIHCCSIKIFLFRLTTRSRSNRHRSDDACIVLHRHIPSEEIFHTCEGKQKDSKDNRKSKEVVNLKMIRIRNRRGRNGLSYLECKSCCSESTN